MDTNVLVSGIFFSGPPNHIVSAWRRRECQFVISPEILDEYQQVVKRLADQYPNIDVSDVIALLMQNSEIIEAEPLPRSVSTDPDDDKFLACAVAGQIDTLVSGDSDLLDLKSYNGVQIITPREFESRYLDQADNE